MIISGYGIDLLRLRHEDIELVREKRNSPEVKQFMEYRGEITPEMQEKWFAGINNVNNNYFVIRTGPEKIGLIYGSQIDWESRETGNGGIFIWDPKWYDNPVSLQATFVLIELTFLLGLERTFVKVLQSNRRAIKFNQDLGYEPVPGQDEVQNQLYVLSKEKFFRQTDRVRKALASQTGNVFHITIDQPEVEAESFLLARLNRLNDEDRKRVILHLP